jgi:expansin (peptidoglycan-binding protein)
MPYVYLIFATVSFSSGRPTMPGVTRRHLRWIVPAATAVLATAVAIVLATQVGGNAACAAGGSASYYTTSRNGLCSLGAPSTDAYVAVGRAEYAGGKACGTYLEVHGPNGTTRVQVVDMCPGCPAGKIDLSKAAFQRVGALSAGIIAVTYDTVRDPQLPGPLRVKLKGGTGYSSLTAVIDNHGNPLSTVELQTPGGFVGLRHSEDNLWTAPWGAVSAPVSLRVSDVYGHQALVTGLALGPADFQQSSALLYGGPSPSPSTVESSAAPESPSAAASQAPSSPAVSSLPSATAPSC